MNKEDTDGFDGVNVPLTVEIPTAYMKFIEWEVGIGTFPTAREVVCEALKRLSWSLIQESVDRSVESAARPATAAEIERIRRHRPS